MKLFSLVIFLICFVIKEANGETNYFSIKLINEEITNGDYARQAKRENGDVYILSATKRQQYNDYYKYISIFDSNSGSMVRQFKYISKYDLMGGEPIFIGENSRYLYISSIIGTDRAAVCEKVDITTETSTLEECNMNAYRRQNLKAGSYYYQMYIIGENNNYLSIDKMTIDGYINNFPNLKIIKNNKSVQTISGGGMISCDITGDKSNILCTYFSPDYEVSVSIYDSNLNNINSIKLEKADDYISGDNFIKIAYLHDNSNFILMNSQDDYIVRFRYFRYENGVIIDKLSSIIKSQNTYLDISHIQTHCHNGENEFIVLSENKLIKLGVHRISNNIIIAIFQFYNNYSVMSIKIYNMINNNEYYSLWQSRINLLKNSFIVSLSALKNEIRYPVYFIINYPNSIDLNLDKSNIMINKLIYLENKMYSVNLKFKVLSIPSNFIIINKSNIEIKNNDELEYNDELILRQYRINGGPYLLKFQSIARGNDSGYTQLLVYPTNAKIPETTVLLEGRPGQITINFKNCLNGYYNFDYDNNLCSNIKPKGYYLDINNKMYKACPNKCEECNAPDSTHRNCISCKTDYYLTEDTKDCYEEGIDNYYLDKDINKLRKCHPNCLKCSTKATDATHMNCLKCQNNLHMTEDTYSCYEGEIDNYYLDKYDNILKKCHPKCLKCSTKATDATHMNCLKCQNNLYMSEDNYSCYEGEIDNYYLDNNDNILKKCHPNCLKCSTKAINSTHMNCLKCQNYLYITEDTQSCYEGEIDNYYLDKDDNKLKRCYKNCLRCSTKANNISFMNCLTCQKDYLLIEDTYSCYKDVIDNYYKDGIYLRKCHPNCLKCSNKATNDTHMNCLKCKNNLYMTKDTQSCYEEGIDNYYLDKDDNILKRCHPNCLKCSTKETNDTHMNCLKCQNNLYMTEDTESCYEDGIDNYYLDKDDNILKRCHPNCLKCKSSPDDNTHMNCITCQPKLYKTEDTESCYEGEIDNYYIDKDANILKKCHQNCLRCNSFPINDTYMRCKTCQPNLYKTEDTYSCYNHIPNHYYLDGKILRICYKEC